MNLSLESSRKTRVGCLSSWNGPTGLPTEERNKKRQAATLHNRALGSDAMTLALRLVLLVGAGLLGACASKLTVTYQSDPPGAALYQGTQMFGYTPISLEYQLTDTDRKSGTKLLQGTTVKWASGASAQVPTLSADLNKFGLNQQFTFQRPDGYPGRDTDMQFALELQKLAIMREQTQAQQDQAYWQMVNALNQQKRAQQRTPTNCTSTLIGNIVQTNCY